MHRFVQTTGCVFWAIAAIAVPIFATLSVCYHWNTSLIVALLLATIVDFFSILILIAAVSIRDVD